MILRPGGVGVLLGVLHPTGLAPRLLTTAPPGQTDSLPVVKPGTDFQPVLHGLERGNERMLAGLAVTGCCSPLVKALTRSVT
jgi:hypothetical protein